jgi:hypothetical protein
MSAVIAKEGGLDLAHSVKLMIGCVIPFLEIFLSVAMQMGNHEERNDDEKKAVGALFLWR